MKSVLTAFAIFAATTAHAHSSFQCNQHGAVVTLDHDTVLYLGTACDAAREGGGTGRWWLTASAFVVEINGHAMHLPFEVNCPALPACWKTD